jgi:hypothetical protein
MPSLTLAVTAMPSFPRKRESICSDVRLKMDSRFRGNDDDILARFHRKMDSLFGHTPSAYAYLTYDGTQDQPD